MSYLLARLLSKSEAPLLTTVNRLESSSGFPRNDIRLLEEMRSACRAAMVVVGLDPDDTTLHELKTALHSRAVEDLEELYLTSKLDQADNYFKFTQKAFNALAKNKVWSLKKSAAKKLISQVPPEHTLKFLGYRSTSSMLKNVPIAEVIWLAESLEPKSWWQNQKNLFKELSPKDFELKTAELIIPNMDVYKLRNIKLGSNQFGAAQLVSQVGAIIYYQSNWEFSINDFVAGVAGLRKASIELNTRSQFIEFSQFKTGFSMLAEQVFREGVPDILAISNQTLSWETLLRASEDSQKLKNYLSFSPKRSFFGLDSCEASLLGQISPRLSWWAKLDSVIFINSSGAVACDLISSWNNSSKKTGWLLSSTAQDTVWQKLLAKYAASGVFSTQIIQQLDNFLDTPETISISQKTSRTVYKKRTSKLTKTRD